MSLLFAVDKANKMPGPALRYHGGKFRLSSWIMQFFPEHTCYVEPFGGAAGVLLQKPRSYAEVYNDLDGDVVNFFRVLRCPVLRAALIEAVSLTPYARSEFDTAWTLTDDPVERARRIAIRAQMGFGSAGATKGKTGFRIDTKRPSSTAQHLWERFPLTLAAVGSRLQGVLIENQPAIDVMRQHDAKSTLHFVDPPYMPSTRVLQSGKSGYYRHEMTEDDHAALLSTLRKLDGMVVVSGHASDLYLDLLSDWKSHSKPSRISANRGTKVRNEMVWINPACSEARKTND